MNVLRIDVHDGRGMIDVAVGGADDADRLRRYVRDIDPDGRDDLHIYDTIRSIRQSLEWCSEVTMVNDFEPVRHLNDDEIVALIACLSVYPKGMASED